MVSYPYFSQSPADVELRALGGMLGALGRPPATLAEAAVGVMSAKIINERTTIRLGPGASGETIRMGEIAPGFAAPLWVIMSSVCPVQLPTGSQVHSTRQANSPDGLRRVPPARHGSARLAPSISYPVQRLRG